MTPVVIFTAGALLGLFAGFTLAWFLVRGRLAIFVGCPRCQERHTHNRMVLERAGRYERSTDKERDA
jgi:hypothetical protein